MQKPSHIAIVMDGNGRWAQGRKRPRTFGHKAGVKTAKEVVRACAEREIEVLTLFAFSSENWRRPAGEVSLLMELFLRALKREVEELDENGVRLSFIGDRSALDVELRDLMSTVEQRTADNERLSLVIAINYGGRWDVVQSCRRLAIQVASGKLRPEDIDEARFDDVTSLSQFGDPDLLIRTGGEMRISNFLLWQCAYAELYFSDVLWPDFGAQQLDDAIEDYRHRQRRFGRVPELEMADEGNIAGA